MNRFSRVTKRYLNTYAHILDQMVTDMTGADLTDSISHRFIVQMIPHHQAAIDMSRNILQYTTDLSLECIADSIIAEQTKSIAAMRAIVQPCGELVDTPSALCRYQRQTDAVMNAMFCAMRTARVCGNVNCDFMWEMLPHHRGAVQMATNALQYTICPDLRPILQAIIVSQKRGIGQMQRLLRRLSC